MVLFDAYPNYILWQNVIRELAIGLVLIYPINITYTALTKESKSELTNNSNNKSLPNRYIADVIDFLLLISPISTLYPFAWITGHHKLFSGTPNCFHFRTCRNLIVFISNYYGDVFNNFNFFFVYKAINQKQTLEHINDDGFNTAEMNSMSNKISLVLKIVMKRIKGDDSSSNLGIRRISRHIKHQKSFESSMGLIAEENSDESNNNEKRKSYLCESTAAAKAS
ncbi:unnamed protein product [Rhizophagus irregularis]|nr:unnamed protein product [Rhizophagus irregularis]